MKRQILGAWLGVVVASFLAHQGVFAAEGDGNWGTIGGGPNGVVYAIAASGTNVFVGGQFDTISSGGGTTANNIAKWNGSNWSVLGSIIPGVRGATYNSPYPEVHAIAVNGTNVYVGGYFDHAGDSTANYAAIWNDTTWSPLPSIDGCCGSRPGVLAIGVSGSDVYFGGSFTQPASNVVRRVGNVWVDLGGGVGGVTFPEVAAVAASGTNVYVGGLFLSAGGNTNIQRVARWDGSTWSSLGNGVNFAVYSVAVRGEDIYVGGGGKIAKWNGSSWSTIADSDGAVWTLAVNGNYLYAGGFFTTIGGTNANNIARWDGTHWSPLGSGVNDSVRAIAVSGGDVYVGGDFGTAGGSPRNYIAVWHEPVAILGATSLPAGTVGVAYNQTLQAGGGTQPYIWSVVSNSLPTGLVFVSATGSITGTPVTATMANFRVRVTDAGSLTSESDFSLTINPIPCSYVLSSMATNASAGGGSGVIALSTVSNCAWTATSVVDWIALTAATNGIGNGAVDYVVESNVTSATRTGTVTIADQTFTVTQSACSYSLSASSMTFGAMGGSSNAVVSATNGCPWTAVSGSGWITVTLGSTGDGNGVVGFTVQGNPVANVRTGSVTAAGQTLTVIQAGNAAPQVTIAPVAVIPITNPTANLDATVSDDGAPTGVITVLWSKVSGAGSVTFGNAGTIDTSATFSTNGVYSLRLVASDGALAGTGTVTVVVDAFPVFSSPPTVTGGGTTVNGQVVVPLGQTIDFTVGASDPDGNPLTCLWDFDDGVTSTDCSPSHVFTNCGPYDVSVTVYDGVSSTSTSLAVAVACPLDVSKFSIKVNFATGKLDSASFKGNMSLPPSFSVENVQVTVNIGSVSNSFELSAKGKGTNGQSQAKVSNKAGEGKLTVKFKGDWDAVWEMDGLTNATVVDQPITMPVLLLLESDPPEAFYAEKALLYKATAGKSGSAK